MRGAALLLSMLGLAACAPRPSSAVPIVGPDGSRMLHVSCGVDEARCYRLAGERCPGGYDIAPSAGSSGNFLVRCRVPMGWQAGAGWTSPPGGVPPRPSPYSGPVLAPSPYGPEPATTAYPPLGATPAPPSDIKETLDVGY